MNKSLLDDVGCLLLRVLEDFFLLVKKQLIYVKGCPSALLLVAVVQTNGEFTRFDYACIKSSVDRCVGYLFVVLCS